MGAELSPAFVAPVYDDEAVELFSVLDVDDDVVDDDVDELVVAARGSVPQVRPPTDLRAAQCSRLKRFPSRRKAEAALRAINQGAVRSRRADGSKPTRARECDFCQGWHLAQGRPGRGDGRAERVRRGGRRR